MASKSSVSVAVAVRPLNDKEQENGEECVVWTQDNEVRVLNPETGKEKVFKFDHTVSCGSTNATLMGRLDIEWSPCVLVAC